MDQRSPSRSEPAINLPLALTLSIGTMLVIHAVRQVVPDVTDLRIVTEFGFIPAPWSVWLGFADAPQVLREAASGIADPDIEAARIGFAQYVLEEAGSNPWSLLTYAALHGSWAHVLLNCVWLAAFGAPVVRRCGTVRSIVLAVASALGGVLAHGLTNPLGTQPVIGASAVVSGYMAAAATFVFAVPPGFSDRFDRRPAATLGALVRNRTALMFLGAWFAINLAVGLLAVPLGFTEGGIAWQAHIGGLLAGLFAFLALDPVRVRHRMAD